MPKQTKTCRVCGASYEACNSVRTGSATFNWREVACSPECGTVYLERITASRSYTEKAKSKRKSKASVHEIASELQEAIAVDSAMTAE